MKRLTLLILALLLLATAVACTREVIREVPVYPTAAPTYTAVATPALPSPASCTEREAAARAKPGVVMIVGRSTQGSGVVIDDSGYILTNSHVVEGDESLTVMLPDGRWVSGELWSLASNVDLAVVRVQASGLHAVKWGDSESLQETDTLIAVGYPIAEVLGQEPSVTTGTLSAKRADLYADWLQMDVALNPGSSGGAVVNLCGELVGISTATIAETEGMNFAVASTTAKPVAEELISHQVRRQVPSGAVADEPLLSPEETAWAFYYLVANREFELAYSLLSQRFQASRPYGKWLAGYDTTLLVFVEEVRTMKYDPPVVYVSVLATDLLNNEVVTRRFAGKWQFAFEGGMWRLDVGDIAEVP
jgi:S1-C subfamily serine protease